MQTYIIYHHLIFLLVSCKHAMCQCWHSNYVVTCFINWPMSLSQHLNFQQLQITCITEAIVLTLAAGYLVSQ